MAIVIKIIGERGTPQEIDISEKGEILLGRASKCDVFLEDNSCSGRHCRIFLFDGQTYLEDLSSTNGTEFNSEVTIKSASRQIWLGDVVRLGCYTLELVRNKMTAEEKGRHHGKTTQIKNSNLELNKRSNK